MAEEITSNDSLLMNVVRESTGEIVTIEHVYTNFSRGITVMRIIQYNAELRLMSTSRGSAVIIRRQEIATSDSATTHLSESVHGRYGWGLVPFASHIFNTGRVELPIKTPAVLAIESRWKNEPS